MADMFKKGRIFFRFEWLLLITLASCVTRQEINQTPKSVPTDKSQPSVNKEVAKSEPRSEEDLSKQEEQKSSSPPTLSIPLAARPQRVGIVLGPAGAPTLVHAGFLQVLIKARIPVAGIVGIELSSLIGAATAHRAEPFRAQWIAKKIPSKQWPTKSNQWSRKSLRNLLQESGFDFDLGQSKIPFACPVFNLRNQKTTLLAKGRASDAITYCASHPLNLDSAYTSVSSLEPIESSARWLRALGAERVIYIDVLSRPSNEASIHNWLWGSFKVRAQEIAERQQVEWISVDHSFGIDDFDKSAELIDLGTKLGERWIQNFNEKGAP